MNINLIYDSSVSGAPSAFTTALTAAAQFLDTQFTNPITINISVGYGEVNGTPLTSNTLGESDPFFDPVSYTQLVAALTQNAKSVDQIAAVANLPSSDPTNGGSFWITTANEQALGIIGPSSALDGYVGFSSTLPFTYNNSNGVAAGTYDFFGVAIHELTEILGRTLFVGGDGIGPNAYTPLDLFHYSAPGVRDFSGTAPGYLSIDGGNTDLGDFNTDPNGDFGDWAGSAGNDSFLAFSSSGVVNAVSQDDLREMNILGYNEAPVLVANHAVTAAIGGTVTIGSSSLSFSEAGYTDAQLTYTIVTGPADGRLLKNGSAVSSFTQADIDNGLIAYQENGTAAASDSFTFTVSDPAGNQTPTQTFQFQVLPATVIESFGTTWLTEIGSNFYLSSSSGSGPELKLGGSPVVAGTLAGWTPIGAVQTAGGYEVAWKVTGADQYSVWNTDSNGNYISNAIGVVSGASIILEAFEPTFQQDLNGDGVIGIAGTVISKDGSTWLIQAGSNFYLSSSGGSGPELKLGGLPVVAGTLAGWTPIGAVQTAGGYEVAWKVTGADQYSVWNTDSNGNYISNAIGVVSGASSILEAFEPTFQQDLNGDGVIGIVGTVISKDGSTWLIQAGSNFYLGSSGGSGPELKLGGSPVVAGTLAGWTPIGAVQTAGGYEVAWKVTGADQYSVWNTDNNGNYTGNAIGAFPGASFPLEAFESTFQQDLNGDGTIGPPGKTVIETAGSTWLTEVGSNFFLYNSSGSGPELKLSGAPVAGTLGGWTPIGAEATASGYEVAWEVMGADQYSVWNTDTSGNYTGNAVGVVSGTSATWEAFELTFHQDLNGDGVIGRPSTAGTSQDILVSNQKVATSSVVSFASAAGGLTNSIPPPSPPQIIATGDFIGDGNLDMLWLGPNNAPELSEMSGGSVVNTISLPAPASSWHLVGGGDLNGDGKPNILWQNSDGTVSIWETNTSGAINATSLGSPGAAWQLMGAADVNGDGKSDLLFVNPTGNQEQVWLMNGSQVASVQVAPAGTVAALLSSNPVLSQADGHYDASGASLLYGSGTSLTDVGTMADATGRIETLNTSDNGSTGRTFTRT